MVTIVPKVPAAIAGSVFAFLAAAGGGAAQSTGTGNDPYTAWHETGPFLWGNLTWTSEARSIAWDPAPTSEDDRPQDATPAQLYAQDWEVQYRTGQPLIHPQPTYRFTSAKLTQPHYLNVSRPIQIELMLKKEGSANECPKGGPMEGHVLELRLEVDGKPLASFIRSEYTNFRVSPVVGPDPAGYAVCRFSLSPELAVLPQDSVVTLDLTLYAQKRPYAFGFQGDHRSRIRFPLYPTEEVLFRHPEFFESDPALAGFADGSGAAANAVSLATLALAVTTARPGPSGRRLPVGALLVSAALAGCLGGDRPSEAATPSATLRGDVVVTQVPDREGISNMSRGSIVGTVHDDLFIPLEGVHVYVRGQSNFASSSKRGIFRLLDVPAGTHQVRFDRPAYEPFEAEIEVKEGFISRPDITLYPTDPGARDSQRHRHDYWFGEDQKPLMDGRIAHQCGGNFGMGCGWAAPFTIPLEPEKQKTILPGTSVVEVALDWDPALQGVHRYGLLVDEHSDTRKNVYGPRGPGEPFRIQTNWEMTDLGHLMVSEWVFSLVEGDAWYDGGYFDRVPRIHYSEPAEITAKVTIRRGGELPLEPGHPDHWQGKTVLPILAAKEPIFGPNGCTFPPGVAPPARTCRASSVIDWPSDNIVPPGTVQLDVVLTLKRTNTLPTAYELRYKPADVAATVDRDSNDRPGFLLASGDGGPNPLRKAWRIEVKPGQNDPEYASKSLWAFAVKGVDSDSMYIDGRMGAAAQLKQTYKLWVNATRG